MFQERESSEHDSPKKRIYYIVISRSSYPSLSIRIYVIWPGDANSIPLLGGI